MLEISVSVVISIQESRLAESQTVHPKNEGFL